MEILLFILLGLEFLGRLVLEVREKRLTQSMGGPALFAVFRLIPLLNDIIPFPESRREPEENLFVKYHEQGHDILRHSILRNLVKVIFLMLAVGLILFLLNTQLLPPWQCLLWLHLAAIPGRVVFHWYCFNQEYEADAYAFKQLGKTRARAAMEELIKCEYAHTPLFALFYREHPTARSRHQRLFRH